MIVYLSDFLFNMHSQFTLSTDVFAIEKEKVYDKCKDGSTLDCVERMNADNEMIYSTKFHCGNYLEQIRIEELIEKIKTKSIFTASNIGGILFVGHGSLNGIEGYSLQALGDIAKTLNSPLVGFICCDLGSPRLGKTALVTNSPKWENLFGIGFDQKVSFQMFLNCGLIEAFSTYIYNLNNQNNNSYDPRQLLRYSISVTKKFLYKNFNNVVFFNDKDKHDSTLEKGLLLYEEKVSTSDLPTLSKFKFFDIVQYHWWTCSLGSRGSDIISELYDSVKISRDISKCDEKFDSAIKELKLNEIKLQVEEVENYLLTEKIIKEVCSGNWSDINNLNDLIVAFTRGYRGSACFDEVIEWTQYITNNASTVADYKFRAVAWLMIDKDVYFDISSPWNLIRLGLLEAVANVSLLKNSMFFF
jgi:hypothetical protein